MIFVFEGQGSVFPGMAKNEYVSNQRFRFFFDYLSTAITDITGYDVAKLCWGEESLQLKNNPLFSHLALFVISGALFKMMLEMTDGPTLMIGHSLGELLALMWSGVLSLEDAVRFIRKRGELFLQEKEKKKSDMVALIGNKDSYMEVLYEMKNGILRENMDKYSLLLDNLSLPSLGELLNVLE